MPPEPRNSSCLLYWKSTPFFFCSFCIFTFTITNRKQRADAKRGFASGQRDRDTLQFQTPPPLVREEEPETKAEKPLKSVEQPDQHKDEEVAKEQTDKVSSRLALMDSSEDDTAVGNAGFTPKEF